MIKNKIIYFSPLNAAFVKKDIKFLENKYEVIAPVFFWEGNAKILTYLFRQFIFFIKNIRSTSATFVMFGGYWSLLPVLISKLFKKKCYIILGGADCVSFPKLNYGSLRLKFLKRIIKFSYKYATKLLPVHEALIYSKYNYSQLSNTDFQGYKFFMPEITTESFVIYNGFDPHDFYNLATSKNEKSFITVALIDSEQRFKLKGIDLILEIAKKNLDCSFTVVGAKKSFYLTLIDVPENLKFVEFIESSELKNYISQHEFYLQLSISEGFPNALCEGMLCECCPIGSNVSSIPYIIGDTGFILERDDLYIANELIKKMKLLSVEEKSKLGKAARNRIVENFHIDKRKEMFEKIISNID